MVVHWKGCDSASLFWLLLVTCNQSDCVVGGTLSETGANADIKEIKIANIDLSADYALYTECMHNNDPSNVTDRQTQILFKT